MPVFPGEDPAQLLTDKERAAFINMSVEEFRALKHPVVAEAEARQAANAKYRADRAAQLAEKALHSPTARIEALDIDASTLLVKYDRCAQVSSIIQTISRRSAKRFKSAVERSLVDDSVLGVRVTRTE